MRIPDNMVFVGPPWSYNIETWPGVSTCNQGMIISNHLAHPLPIIDPPTFPPTSPGGQTMSGGKKRLKNKSKKRRKKRKKTKKK